MITSAHPKATPFRSLFPSLSSSLQTRLLLQLMDAFIQYGAHSDIEDGEVNSRRWLLRLLRYSFYMTACPVTNRTCS